MRKQRWTKSLVAGLILCNLWTWDIALAESSLMAPATGDDSHFFIWIIVGLVAARLLAKLVRKMKKDKEQG